MSTINCTDTTTLNVKYIYLFIELVDGTVGTVGIAVGVAVGVGVALG
jgi:hypothetical protein